MIMSRRAHGGASRVIRNRNLSAVETRGGHIHMTKMSTTNFATRNTAQVGR